MEQKQFDANKFLDAQRDSYENALKEINNGRKTSHWIWYIFPQIAGLGRSHTSEFYAIKDLEEAKEYLANDTLKSRLIEISDALLLCDGNIKGIFGSPDYLKVRSCMTLFQKAAPDIKVFQAVLDKFYDGIPDRKTLSILSGNYDDSYKKQAWFNLARVFEDTMSMIKADYYLGTAIDSSVKNTVLYSPDAEMKLPKNPAYFTEISVSRKRSFEAAKELWNNFSDSKIAVLNFASAVNPGGNVMGGSMAQEESLCRCSTLYPCLAQPFLYSNYYNYNRDHIIISGTDACIYTPDVLVIKTDTDIPERLPCEDWYNVDIITCAAPYLCRNKDAISEEEQYIIHCQRARRIISAAIIGGDDILILGAFGCGAYRNNPWAVAKAYKDVLSEYDGYFRCVEFAVFCSSEESENYKAFAETFRK